MLTRALKIICHKFALFVYTIRNEIASAAQHRFRQTFAERFGEGIVSIDH
tara:strand:- start:2958 stop:3107 length:150 start_codon:yes stop_codon:yes gene_type:complete